VPTDDDYARLLAFRTRLRRFEQWSKEAAAAQGLTQQQHQLLLAIRGHGGGLSPTVGEVADYLLVKHHTAGELIDRTQELGLIERTRDQSDHRVVRLALTRKGKAAIRALSAVHLEELRRLGPGISAL
jgi:DNA-binding MarR family transcriptional regulator